MRKDERFGWQLAGTAIAAFAAGVWCFCAHRSAVVYQPVSFDGCTDAAQIALVFLRAFLRTAWPLLLLSAAAFTRFVCPACFCVMTVRAFPAGLAAGDLYAVQAWTVYALFLVFTVAVAFLYLYVCCMAYAFAYATDGPVRALDAPFHARQFFLRYLNACGILVFLTALWCCGCLNGLIRV